MTIASALFRPAAFIKTLSLIVGPENVLSGRAEQSTYKNDAYSLESALPLCAVLPATTEEVSSIVKTCAAAGIPFAPRGAGTGLAGGAVISGGVLIGLSRMRKILEVDLRNRRMTVQAGAVNVNLSKAVAADGFIFAPDPSSGGASTIGGNIANNAGGPHT